MRPIIGPDINPEMESEVPVYFLNGLGLVATGKRRLNDITPFLRYFPSPDGDDTPYNKGEYVRTGKVLKLIEERVNRYHRDTERFSKEYISKGLHPSSQGYVKEVCKRLYQWLFDYIQYKPDRAGREELRRPARVVQEAKTGVDCDCYTYFISTVLKNLKIPHKLRIIAVGDATAYHHIYVVVPNGQGSLQPYRDKYRYTVVDPVLDTFDAEPQGISAYHDFLINVPPTPALNGAHTTMTDDLYNKLKTTRELMVTNPASYQNEGINTNAAVPMIDEALRAWYTPQRDIVLARLSQLDYQIYTGVNGMGGFFKNVANAAKKVTSEVKTVVKTAVTDPKKLINQTVDKAKDIIDKAIDYGRTGALFIPRKAFMGLVELNVRGLASKLKRGLEDPAITDRLKRLWEGDLGGNFSNLTGSINRGANKPFLFGLQGLNGDPVTIASLTASAGGVLAAIQPILEAIEKFTSSGAKMIEAGKTVANLVSRDKNKGIVATSPVILPPATQTFDVPASVDTNTYAAPTGANPNWSAPNNTDNSGGGNNTLMWVGGTVAAGLLLYAAAANSNKKKGLNGLEGAKHTRKAARPKPKGRVASITF